MTQITTAYNALIARIEALLTDHVRLGDSINLAENDDLSLRQGYGVAFGPGERDVEEIEVVGCKRVQNKTFEIVLTRDAIAKQSDGATKDAVALQLHEDLATIINDLTLDGTLNTGATVTDWIDDSGIEQIEEKERFLSLRANFNVKLRDVLT